MIMISLVGYSIVGYLAVVNRPQNLMTVSGLIHVQLFVFAIMRILYWGLDPLNIKQRYDISISLATFGLHLGCLGSSYTLLYFLWYKAFRELKKKRWQSMGMTLQQVGPRVAVVCTLLWCGLMTFDGLAARNVGGVGFTLLRICVSLAIFWFFFTTMFLCYLYWGMKNLTKEEVSDHLQRKLLAKLRSYIIKQVPAAAAMVASTAVMLHMYTDLVMTPEQLLWNVFVNRILEFVFIFLLLLHPPPNVHARSRGSGASG